MEIVYIPVEILHKMALWLSQQQNEDGAFVETSEYYYDRSFLVNIVDLVVLWQISMTVAKVGSANVSILMRNEQHDHIFNIQRYHALLHV